MWCLLCNWAYRNHRDNPRKQPKKTTQEKVTRPSSGQEQRKAKILKFCEEPKPLFDIMQHLGLKAWKNVMNLYIIPMIEAGLLEMTDPDSHEP